MLNWKLQNTDRLFRALGNGTVHLRLINFQLSVFPIRCSSNGHFEQLAFLPAGEKIEIILVLKIKQEAQSRAVDITYAQNLS